VLLSARETRARGPSHRLGRRAGTRQYIFDGVAPPPPPMSALVLSVGGFKVSGDRYSDVGVRQRSAMHGRSTRCRID